MIMTKAPLLEVKNLSIEFPTKRGTVKAVDGVSWTVDQGETLAILGESGSGKSVSSSAVMDLIDTPPAVSMPIRRWSTPYAPAISRSYASARRAFPK